DACRRHFAELHRVSTDGKGGPGIPQDRGSERKHDRNQLSLADGALSHRSHYGETVMSASRCTISSGRRRATRRRSGGFTLVEVLATILLLSIVLPVAMHGISVAMQAAGAARHRVEAASLGDAKLQDLLVENLWLSGNQAGDFSEEGFPDYQWALDQNVVDVDLTEISIHVTWKARNQDQEV